ncbi:hypothetical protein [Streptomyces sp. NPDC002746]
MEPVELLRWHAGVVALTTGVRIEVTADGGIPRERVDRLVYSTVRFSLVVCGTRNVTATGPMHFVEPWSFLDGVKTGAIAAAAASADD